MEESSTALRLRNLPLVGRYSGNCVFLHQYTLGGRQRRGHSVWHNGTLALMEPDSWLWNFVEISETRYRPPDGVAKMSQLATFAFEHTSRGALERNFGELVTGIQTMYSNQIINGAENLPLRHNVVARVYTTPPFIVEIVR